MCATMAVAVATAAVAIFASAYGAPVLDDVLMEHMLVDQLFEMYRSHGYTSHIMKDSEQVITAFAGKELHRFWDAKTYLTDNPKGYFDAIPIKCYKDNSVQFRVFELPQRKKLFCVSDRHTIFTLPIVEGYNLIIIRHSSDTLFYVSKHLKANRILNIKCKIFPTQVKDNKVFENIMLDTGVGSMIHCKRNFGHLEGSLCTFHFAGNTIIPEISIHKLIKSDCEFHPYGKFIYGLPRVDGLYKETVFFDRYTGIPVYTGTLKSHQLYCYEVNPIDATTTASLNAARATSYCDLGPDGAQTYRQARNYDFHGNQRQIGHQETATTSSLPASAGLRNHENHKSSTKMEMEICSSSGAHNTDFPREISPEAYAIDTEVEGNHETPRQMVGRPTAQSAKKDFLRWWEKIQPSNCGTQQPVAKIPHAFYPVGLCMDCAAGMERPVPSNVPCLSVQQLLHPGRRRVSAFDVIVPRKRAAQSSGFPPAAAAGRPENPNQSKSHNFAPGWAFHGSNFDHAPVLSQDYPEQFNEMYRPPALAPHGAEFRAPGDFDDTHQESRQVWMEGQDAPEA